MDSVAAQTDNRRVETPPTTRAAWEVSPHFHSPRSTLTSVYSEVDDTTTTLLYDLSGNLTKKGNDEYYWSSEDKLTKVLVNGRTSVEYWYDLAGNGACKRVGNGDWRWYFYDGLKVVAEGTGTGNRIHYTNSPGAIGGIICRDATGANGEKLWYHYDRLGNVVAVTNEYGLVDLYSMDAFGNVVQPATGTNGYDETYGPSQPYHLTTKELDPDTGLYYFNARWYDAATGRSVSVDRISRSGTVVLRAGHYHLYSFAGCNPLIQVDPTGRCSWKVHHQFTRDAIQGYGLKCCYKGRDIGSSIIGDSDDPDFSLWPPLPRAHDRDHCVGKWSSLAEALDSAMEGVRAAGKKGCPYIGEAIHTLQDCFAHWKMGTIGWEGHEDDVYLDQEYYWIIVNSTALALRDSGCCK